MDPLESFTDAMRGGAHAQGGVPADECAALYAGPDAELPPEEQANL